VTDILKFPTRDTLIRRYVEVGMELYFGGNVESDDLTAELEMRAQDMDDDALAEQVAAGSDQLGADWIANKSRRRGDGLSGKRMTGAERAEWLRD
jgi:hypothetical protein